MAITLKEQAEKVLRFLEQMPNTQNPIEIELRRATWSLCQQAIELVTASDDGQFTAPSIM